MPAKTRAVIKALQKKGFVEDRVGDHIYYTYMNSEGKVDCRIRTKISHGNRGTISEDLLHAMRREMMFDKKEQLTEYIACTFSLEQYRQLLTKKGLEEH